ncbi:hypothetical protein F1880_003799 [Penicillium rolfsii]|nr:hypothetical protein F1880_003799 [Penicillium rolfsii]
MANILSGMYAATRRTVAFLFLTALFPIDFRAQGNGFGITGWAIGVGMTTLVNLIMFDSLKSRTHSPFVGLNLLWTPIVFLFYPKPRIRSSESIEALFLTPSPFCDSSDAEQNELAFPVKQESENVHV